MRAFRVRKKLSDENQVSRISHTAAPVISAARVEVAAARGTTSVYSAVENGVTRYVGITDKEALDAATKQDEPHALITRFAPVAYGEKFLTKIIAADLEPVIEHYKSGKMAPPHFGSLLMPSTDEDREKDKLRHKQATSELFWKLLKIANYAYMVKAPFFDEEEEWRILTLVTNLDKVLDMPGAQFQASSEKLKPFKDFPQKGFAPSAIKEVILGPRNQTPDEVVRLFLNSQGFDHVSIRRSSGSYR